jgi:hypothetical protein
MQESNRIGKSIHEDIQKLIAEGKNYYDGNTDVELGFIYEGGEEDPLWNSVETWHGNNDDSLMSEYEGTRSTGTLSNYLEFETPHFNRNQSRNAFSRT